APHSSKLSCWHLPQTLSTHVSSPMHLDKSHVILCTSLIGFLWAGCAHTPLAERPPTVDSSVSPDFLVWLGTATPAFYTDLSKAERWDVDLLTGVDAGRSLPDVEHQLADYLESPTDDTLIPAALYASGMLRAPVRTVTVVRYMRDKTDVVRAYAIL